MKIILASGSPRRSELMRLAGFDFDVVIPDVDESIPDDMPAQSAVIMLSLKKAQAALATTNEPCIVVAADTVVVLDDVILGKPSDKEDAFRMLSMLSGRTHHVFTGVTVIKNGVAGSFYSDSTVTFFKLTEEEIYEYISTGEPMDKAGAYGIQGKGCLLVKELCGDYYNIVGLPIAETARAIRD